MFNITRTQVIEFLKGAGLTLLIGLLYVLGTAITGHAQNLRATPIATTTVKTKLSTAKKSASTTVTTPLSTTASLIPLPVASAPTGTSVAATSTSATSTNAASSKAPAGASSFLNPYLLGMNTQSMAVKGIFDAIERINLPDSLKKPVGPVGIGLSIQSNGSLLANLTAKTKWGGYITLIAGRKKNEFYENASGQLKQNPIALVGAGIVTKPHFFIGGLLGAQAYQDISQADTKSYALKAGKLKPTLMYGLQVTAELRHVWVNANLLSGAGLGVGATYFF